MKALATVGLLAAVALLPTGLAQCVPSVGCATIDGAEVGDCNDRGFAYNVVSITTVVAGANVQTYCGGFGWLKYRGVYAAAFTCVAGCTGAAVDWSEWSWGSGSMCDTRVTVFTPASLTRESLGCPAGGPPLVPKLLP